MTPTKLYTCMSCKKTYSKSYESGKLKYFYYDWVVYGNEKIECPKCKGKRNEKM